jgi:hypothetical protein
MAHTHIKQAVLELQERIKKVTAIVESEEESTNDMLTALESLNVDANIIKTTGIGNTLNDLKKACKEKKLDSVFQKSNKILSAWKDLIKGKKEKDGETATASSVSTAKGASSSTPAKLAVAGVEFVKVQSPAAVVSTSAAAGASAFASTALYPNNDSRKKLLSPDRKTTVNVISKSLQKKGSCVSEADHFALNIEAAVHKTVNEDTKRGLYLEKVKNLTFNLSKNEVRV